MLLFKQAESLRKHLSQQRQKARSIGFVPTMGALHQGHLSLVQQSKELTDISVVSIFVNPTQFNEEADLFAYPRTPEKDILKLKKVGTDVIFMPEKSVIYPSDIDLTIDWDFSHLTQNMEGKFRPGHFEGVVMVVKRLLDLVHPTHLFMGQKDFQQAVLIQNMIQHYQLPVSLAISPIVREKDGLAMSSRNVHLTPIGRGIAPIIAKTLKSVKERVGMHTPLALKQWALEQFSNLNLEVDYFEIVHAQTLKPIAAFNPEERSVACTVVRIDGVRLLDNIYLT